MFVVVIRDYERDIDHEWTAIVGLYDSFIAHIGTIFNSIFYDKLHFMFYFCSLIKLNFFSYS